MLDDKELISLLYQTIARDSLKLASVSDDLGVAPETISRWKKSGKLGRSNRDALAVWLASKGVDLEAELMKNRLPSPPPERPKIVPNAFFINAAETFKPVPLLTIGAGQGADAAWPRRCKRHSGGFAGAFPPCQPRRFRGADCGQFDDAVVSVRDAASGQPGSQAADGKPGDCDAGGLCRAAVQDLH